ncbi:MAG: hypothetical protein AAGC67_17025 [Myxococcota bacterium]
MSALVLWGGAAALYLGFRLWYDGFRRPLTTAEIDAFMKQANEASVERASDLEEIRRFLEEDDGQEFVMLNLVKLHPDPVPHPDTGELQPARRILGDYVRDFMPTLLGTGGLPLMQARKVGPYVDSWDVAPDPGWTMVGYMRYRSRRDMMRLSLHPRFQGGHGYKFAAIAATLSFPTRPQPLGFLGPRVWVALVLALGAALLQIATG